MDPMWPAVFLLGLVVGSFLNVCIHRLPRRQSVVFPRSRCPHCDHRIRAWENIPVLSYVWLRGRCSKCRKPISPLYPLVELLSGLAALVLYAHFGWTSPFLVNFIFFSGLIVLVFIDLLERILPNPITLGGALVGFFLSPLQDVQLLGGDGSLTSALWSSFLGLLLGGGVLWAVAELYLRIRKVEGMGFGDIKMMAMVGAFLGWKLAWLTIFLGALGGAVLGAAFILIFGKGSRYELPFGTFLGFAAMAATLWGPSLVTWYFGPSL